MRNIVYLSDTQEAEIEQWLNGDNVGNMKLQSALYIPEFCIHRSKINQKYLKKENTRTLQKAKLAFLAHQQLFTYLLYLYSIYIVLAIVVNLEVI